MRALVLVILVACGSGEDAGPDAGPASTYEGEILRNGDFEYLDSTGWIAEWTNMDSNPGGVITVVDDPVHSGNHAVQWQVEAASSGYEFWFYQPDIPANLIHGGETYELTGWFMTDHVSPELAFNYWVRGEPDDSPDISTVPNVPVGPTEANVWQHFAYDITIPDGSPASWQFALHSLTFDHKAEVLTVDGVSLHPKY